jgi:hypothetical protein
MNDVKSNIVSRVYDLVNELSIQDQEFLFLFANGDVGDDKTLLDKNQKICANIIATITAEQAVSYMLQGKLDLFAKEMSGDVTLFSTKLGLVTGIAWMNYREKYASKSPVIANISSN